MADNMSLPDADDKALLVTTGHRMIGTGAAIYANAR